MKTLYLDVFSGLSGDMFIGALLDLGVDFRQLEYGLAKLHLDGYRLEHRRAAKHGIEGVKFDVQLTEPAPPPEDGPDYHAHSHSHAHSHGPGEHAHSHGPGVDHAHDGSRNFTQIKALIRASTLSEWVKEKSLAVFQRIAVAEGKIHGMPPEQVHFHEVGAVDSIVDIVGGCLALELLDALFRHRQFGGLRIVPQRRKRILRPARRIGVAADHAPHLVGDGGAK